MNVASDPPLVRTLGRQYGTLTDELNGQRIATRNRAFTSRPIRCGSLFHTNASGMPWTRVPYDQTLCDHMFSIEALLRQPKSLTEGQGPPSSSPALQMGGGGSGPPPGERAEFHLYPCLGNPTTHFLTTGGGRRAVGRCWPGRTAGLV